MTATRNEDRLNRGEGVIAKGGTPRTWRSGSVTVSVMTREDAGVEADEPWIASCDTHGEMIACPTKRLAIVTARDREWCSGCRQDQSQ